MRVDPYGGTVHVQVLFSAVVNLPPDGEQLRPTIPNNPAFCGVNLVTQAVMIDSGASPGFAFTAGLELVLGQ